MKPKVTISIEKEKLIVRSPYNTIFVTQAKKFGGKWSDPSWVFDVREETRIRDLCKMLYGTDGVCSPDIVSVRAILRSPDNDCYRGPITIFGRVVARAFGRDSGARVGDGVVILEGGFNSGGSVKNWRTVVKDKAEIILRDVPRGLAEKEIAKGADWITLEEETVRINCDELKSEREKLAARISEINRILTEQDAQSPEGLSERMTG